MWFSFKISLLWVAFHILDFSSCLCDLSSSVVCGCCIFFVHRIIFFVQFLQIIVKQLAETIIEYIEVWSHILLYKLSSDTEIKTGNNKRCCLEDNQVVFLWTGGSSELTSWISSKPWAEREEADQNSRGSSCSLQLHAPGSPLDQSPEQKQTVRMSACCLFDPQDSPREINKKNQYESIRLKTRADICQTFNTDICRTDVQMDSSCSTNPYTSNCLGRELLCCIYWSTLNYRTTPSHFHFIIVWFVDRKSNAAGSAASVLVQLNTGRCFIDGEATELIRNAQ